MGHIYYALGLIFLIYQLWYITQYHALSRVKRWQEAFKKASERDPLKSDYQNPIEFDLLKGTMVIGLFEFIWLLFGLVTNSWAIFGLLFLALFLAAFLKKIINQFSYIGVSIAYSALFIKFITTLLLIINHFHLHLDLFTLLKNYV